MVVVSIIKGTKHILVLQYVGILAFSFNEACFLLQLLVKFVKPKKKLCQG